MHLHEDVEGDKMKIFKNKLQIEITAEQLRKSRRLSNLAFHVYKYASLLVIGVMGYIVSLMFEGISDIQMENGVHLLVLFGIFSMINFFLLFFLWMTNESSYYRNEQQWAELWLYLKGEDPLDDLKEKKKRYE